MNTPQKCCSAIAFALTLGLPAAFPADPPTPNPENEEPVVLDTFTINISRDNGYIAVDSLAGGRTNTPIKLSPASISTLTRAFIDDLSIQNVRDALRWTTNVVPADPLAGKGFGGQAFQDWSYNFRGAGAGEQGGPGPTRNYFSFFGNEDTYNVERIEFLRGPNSIIFGIGTVGGQLSSYTKLARLDRDLASATLLVDSNRSVRVEADINRRLSKVLAIRVNAVNDNNNGWRENDTNKFKAADVAFTYRPMEGTVIRVEGEYAKVYRTLISSVIDDKLSGWDGTTASNTWGATPTGSARVEHIQNPGAWGDWLTPYWVYVPSLGSRSLMGWAGGWASTTSIADVGTALHFQPYKGYYPSQVKLAWQTAYSSTDKVPVLPDRDWTYGSGQSNKTYKNLTISVSQKLSKNLDLVVSGYRYLDEQTAQDYETSGGAAIDINKQLPDGTANPNFGKPFADFMLSKQVQDYSITEGRAQLNFHFDTQLLGSAWQQLFSLQVSAKDLKHSARQYLGQVGNGTTITNPADWVYNMIWGRIYLDHPNVVMNPPQVAPNGRTIAYMPKADGYWFDFDDSFKPKDVMIMSQSRFFDDSLSITAGYRREKYTEHLVELRRGPNLTDKVSDESQSANTVTVGATYFLKFGLGAFANYSKNIQPPQPGSQPYLSGSRPAPEAGKGYDFGLRYSSRNGKYWASVSRYSTTSEGHLVENPVAIRGIWQKYNIALGNPSDAGNGSLAFSDTTSLDVKGYEAEVTANPTSSLRISANLGKPDATIVDYYPMSRAYFGNYLSSWNTAVNNAALDATKRNDLRSAIADVQNALDQAIPGAKNKGLVKYTASIAATYSFPNESLKGYAVGGALSFTGKRYDAVYDKREYYGSSITTTALWFTYETKIHGVQTRFALNIDNVLDKKDPIVTSFHWGYTDPSGTHVRDGFYLPAPRTFRFSTRFSF